VTRTALAQFALNLVIKLNYFISEVNNCKEIPHIAATTAAIFSISLRFFISYLSLLLIIYYIIPSKKTRLILVNSKA
jgi:hypothetical protein